MVGRGMSRQRYKTKVMTSQHEDEEEEFECIEDYNNFDDEHSGTMSPIHHPRKRKGKNAKLVEQNAVTKYQGVIRPPEVLDLTDSTSASSSIIQCRSNRFDASDMAVSDEEEEKRTIEANRKKRPSKAEKTIPSRIEPALGKILFKRILDLRSRMGEEENKAPHIFMGRHLAENLSRLAPTTIDELKLCGSMSAKKLRVSVISSPITISLYSIQCVVNDFYTHGVSPPRHTYFTII